MTITKQELTCFTVNGQPCYRVIRHLGRGGSADCYLVRRIQPDGMESSAYCALKEFHPSALAYALHRTGPDQRWTLTEREKHRAPELEEMRSMFTREAEMCARINETAGSGQSNFPWILHCQGVPGREDLLEVTTEEGYSLADFIADSTKGLLDAERLALYLQMTDRLLRVLDSVHRQYLHLDIKPQNIWLATSEKTLNCQSLYMVKVFDLASACAKEAFRPGSPLLKEWLVRAACTPLYADPRVTRLALDSQFGGADRFFAEPDSDIDERVDWFSVGAVLYELLCGEPINLTELDTAVVYLPEDVKTGALADPELCGRLEHLLNKALRLTEEYTLEDVRTHAFLRDIDELIQLLQSGNRNGLLIPIDPLPAPSAPTRWERALSGAVEGALDAFGYPDQRLINTFSPEEEAAYDLQKTVLMLLARGAQDKLSSYTNHSIHHIREVMDQTALLFDALTKWLSGEIHLNSVELEHSRVHLLLAAKFHDIGMSGTAEMRELLDLVDQLSLLTAHLTPQASQTTEQLIQRMRPLAETADRQVTGGLKGARFLTPSLRALLAMSPTAPGFAAALATVHEEIKDNIRRNHGESSARWILEHRDFLTARYGTAINWQEIALLAALHTGFVSFLPDDDMRVPLTYCAQLMKCMGMTAPLLDTEEDRRRIFALSAILRLSDQRRTGKLLRTLDGCRIELRPSIRGNLRISYAGGKRDQLPFTNDSYEVIVSERVCDFGQVDVQSYGGHWVMTHEMILSYEEYAESRQLFFKRRLPAYAREIQESLFEPGGSLRHVLLVHPASAPMKQPRETVEQMSIEAMLERTPAVCRQLERFSALLEKSEGFAVELTK